jgi:hypothetical protein
VAAAAPAAAESRPRKYPGFLPSPIQILIILAMLALEYFVFDRVLEVPAREASVVARFYSAITHAGYRKIVPRYCTLVRISPEYETDPCKTRARLNEIFTRVLSYHPRAVVADYILTSNICPTETAQLLRTVQRACEALPIGFAYQLQYDERNVPSIAPFLNIGPGRESHCVMGYSSMKPDFRKVPLVVQIRDQEYPSLSFAVAKELRPDIERNPALKEAAEAAEPLFTSVFDTEEFPQVLDRELTAASPAAELTEKIWQRVVVIGSELGPDTTSSRVPSSSFHASYIEAYLDDRLLREVPEWIHLLLGVIFWIVVEAAPTFRRAAAMILGGFLAFLALDVMLIQFLGVYNDFSMFSIGGIFIWLSGQLTVRMHHERAAATPHG